MTSRRRKLTFGAMAIAAIVLSVVAALTAVALGNGKIVTAASLANALTAAWILVRWTRVQHLA